MQICGRLRGLPRPVRSATGDLVPYSHSSGSYITTRHFVFVTVTRFATLLYGTYYLSLSICIHTVNLAANGSRVLYLWSCHGSGVM